jgi:hypothetical protein
VGDVVLTFMSRYPKFANHVSEPVLVPPPGGNGGAPDDGLGL